MKHALDMLADVPGVRHVMLVTEDGVPVATAGSGSKADGESGDGDCGENGLPELGTEDALAGLAVGLLTDLSIAVGQMSWNHPRRVVLRAARGTLVLQTMQGAVLLVLLAQGLRADELKLSMDGTIARIERTLRDMGGMDADLDEDHLPPGLGSTMETPGPLPSSEGGSGVGTRIEEATEQGEPGSPQ